MATKFPAIGVMGPRQSGKTTLVREIFKKHAYVSLEELDVRAFAKEDPRGFLGQFKKKGVILDEIQKVPELFSYLQSTIDQNNIPGQFILTGSQNFLLHEQISQSLAGRIGLVKLLPFSFDELKQSVGLQDNVDQYIFTGFYPRIYDRNIPPMDWYSSYLQTYIEKDLRQIKDISDLGTFQKFFKLCAGRTGQLLNLSGLAVECGISHNTAKSWISVLEASFIIFLLQPHHKNFNKRLVKMPKLYFYDTGLVCSLLGMESEKQLHQHYLRGQLFENLVIAEIIKQRVNKGLAPGCYFWRDKTGHEVDCLVEHGAKFIPIEIKSGQTINTSFFENLQYWQKISAIRGNAFLVYGGNEDYVRKGIRITSWNKLPKF